MSMILFYISGCLWPNKVNSFTPDDANIHQWVGLSLVQVMACHCSLQSHNKNQRFIKIDLAVSKKFQWNLMQNMVSFIQQNAIENVICKIIITLINISSGNGLLPDGIKPLPEPMLTYHQWGLAAFTWGKFDRKSSWYLLLIINSRLQPHLPGTMTC